MDIHGRQIKKTGDSDELFQKAVEEVVQYDFVSASLLQRVLDIRYAKAARLIEQLEKAEVIGPQVGTKPRKVLIKTYEEFIEKLKIN
jgi:DNA segregation ATPase FtsK/SpoIIIE, S-DNA-T family